MDCRQGNSLFPYSSSLFTPFNAAVAPPFCKRNNRTHFFFRAQQQRQAEEEKMALITIHLTTGFQKGYAEEKRITRCRGDGDT